MSKCFKNEIHDYLPARGVETRPLVNEAEVWIPCWDGEHLVPGSHLRSSALHETTRHDCAPRTKESRFYDEYAPNSF